MCGIAGLYGSFELRQVDKMSHLIAHRGPDDDGVFVDAPAGLALAHRRLAIIDLSPAGHQPMATSDGSIVITFNGEIYNYRELRQTLEREGAHFRSQGDTEVLLAMYRQHGPGMLEHLNGIFAFAIWDVKEQRLFVARDQLGVKPLYYAETRRGFAFASEAKALLCLDEVDGSLDPHAIFSHLVYLWCPAPATALRGIRKLEPGHAMTIRAGQVERRWSFYSPPCNSPMPGAHEDELIERVHQQFKTAVDRQMVADVPLGTFLSGGLDSSSVTWAATQARATGRLDAFTIDLQMPMAGEAGFADDLPFARRVAKDLDVALHEIRVGPEMAQMLQFMMYHLDEPQADPAPLNVYFISKLARSLGTKVLLSGAGGDDIFTGYRRHFALQLEPWWSWLPHSLRRLMASSARRMAQSSATGRRISKAFSYAHLPEELRLVSYFFWIDPLVAHGLLSSELRKLVSPDEVFAPLTAALQKLPPEAPALSKMLCLEQLFFLSDHNLNYTDKMSMAAGIEVRVPYLDVDLVDFASRVPVNLKQRGSEGKWLMKRAMEPHLAREVIYRPKTGFGAPIRRWLRVELRGMVENVLSDSSLEARGVFDPAAVRSLIRDDAAGRIDGSYTILALVCVELWCRLFLDGRAQLRAGRSPLVDDVSDFAASPPTAAMAVSS